MCGYKEYYIVRWASGKKKTFTLPVESITDLKNFFNSVGRISFIIYFGFTSHQYSSDDGMKIFTIDNVNDAEKHFGVSPIMGEITVYDSYVE